MSLPSCPQAGGSGGHLARARAHRALCGQRAFGSLRPYPLDKHSAQRDTAGRRGSWCAVCGAGGPWARCPYLIKQRRLRLVGTSERLLLVPSGSCRTVVRETSGTDTCGEEGRKRDGQRGSCTAVGPREWGAGAGGPAAWSVRHGQGLVLMRCWVPAALEGDANVNVGTERWAKLACWP